MFRVRGKTYGGLSITGVSHAESFGDVVAEIEAQAEAAGDSVTQVTIKTLDGQDSSIKIATPRKREAPAKRGKGK